MKGAMSLHVSSHSHVREVEDETEGGLYAEPQEEPLVFVHIPKNAGTAVENAGLASWVRWGRHRMYYFGMVPMPDEVHWCAAHHVPPKLLPVEIQEIYLHSKVFCVVRNPYDRAVSEYKYLLSVPWGITKPGVLDKEPCTREGLNYFLQKALTTVSEGMQYVNDCHMLPQTDFVYDGEREWCGNVLRMEEMPGTFNDLMEREGYSVRINETENDSNTTCPGLGVQDLDPETIAILDEVYAEDFDRLGFAHMASAI